MFQLFSDTYYCELVWIWLLTGICHREVTRRNTDEHSLFQHVFSLNLCVLISIVKGSRIRTIESSLKGIYVSLCVCVHYLHSKIRGFQNCFEITITLHISSNFKWQYTILSISENNACCNFCLFLSRLMWYKRISNYYNFHFVGY